MKPARFTLLRPRSLDEAVRALENYGDTAKVLAGGQSLLPMMHIRLVEPAIVIDINLLEELAGVSTASDGVVQIGALTRHLALEQLSVPHDLAPVFAKAAAHIGHVPIRTRGTFGGSLAHADPAAEWPVLLVALGATIVARGIAGERCLEASAFFEGPYTTALSETELLTGARVPSPGAHAAVGFAEVSRRAGDFATALAAVRIDAQGGWIANASLAVGGLAGGASRCAEAEALLVGASLDMLDPSAVGDVVREVSSANDDLHATASYRRAMAGVAACDAVDEALGHLRAGLEGRSLARHP